MNLESTAESMSENKVSVKSGKRIACYRPSWYQVGGRICCSLMAAANCSLFTVTYYLNIGESIEGRMADALAHGGDEGRDKLR